MSVKSDLLLLEGHKVKQMTSQERNCTFTVTLFTG